MDPFSDTEKVLVDHDTKKGNASVLLKGRPPTRVKTTLYSQLRRATEMQGSFP